MAEELKNQAKRICETYIISQINSQDNISMRAECVNADKMIESISSEPAVDDNSFETTIKSLVDTMNELSQMGSTALKEIPVFDTDTNRELYVRIYSAAVSPEALSRVSMQTAAALASNEQKCRTFAENTEVEKQIDAIKTELYYLDFPMKAEFRSTYAEAEFCNKCKVSSGNAYGWASNAAKGWEEKSNEILNERDNRRLLLLDRLNSIQGRSPEEYKYSGDAFLKKEYEALSKTYTLLNRLSTLQEVYGSDEIYEMTSSEMREYLKLDAGNTSSMSFGDFIVTRDKNSDRYIDSEIERRIDEGTQIYEQLGRRGKEIYEFRNALANDASAYERMSQVEQSRVLDLLANEKVLNECVEAINSVSDKLFEDSSTKLQGINIFFDPEKDNSENLLKGIERIKTMEAEKIQKLADRQAQKSEKSDEIIFEVAQNETEFESDTPQIIDIDA